MGNSYTSLSSQDPDHLNNLMPNHHSNNDHVLTRKRTKSVGNAANSSSTSTNTVPPCTIKPSIHTDAVTTLAAVRPGMVLSGGRDAQILLNNIDTGECVLRWRGHTREVTKLAYMNAIAKHYILSGSRDTTIKLWQFNSPTAVATFEGHGMSVSEHSFCSGSRDATLRIWDINTAKVLLTVSHSRNLVTHISYAPGGHILAQSSEDKELKLWDKRDLCLIHQFPKKRHIQTHCDILPDGLYCLSSSNGFNRDGCEITMWDLRQRKLLREFRGHTESVNCAIYLPQQITWKRLLLSVGADRSVRLWNSDEDGGCVWSEYLPGGSDLLSCVGFSDGSVVVAGLNGCLGHLRLNGRAGKPYLHCVGVQLQPTHSSSAFQLSSYAVND